jgi:hypothetical protein
LNRNDEAMFEISRRFGRGVLHGWFLFLLVHWMG